MSDAIWQTLQGRQLALYPECAVLENELERKSCCDKKVKSIAGRNFCYTDIIYNAGEFDKCKNTDVVEIFKCCEDLDMGNKDYAFDCQAELTKAGCTSKDDCTANYKTGLEAYTKYKKSLEPSLPLDPPVVIEEAVTDKIWFKIVVYGVVALLGSGLIFFLICVIKTKCGKNPFRKNSNNIVKDQIEFVTAT